MSVSTRRILVIGVGSIGERHLRCFKNTGRADVAICEPNDKLRADVAGRYDIARAYASLSDALKDEHDAAVICTPAPLHIPIAIDLAKAGIHLLIEKPLSTTFDRIDELKTIVREKQLTVAVAYVHRANPVLAQMRDALVSGRFGKPRHLVAQCGQHFPTYRPAYREIYYTDRKQGGGAIQDAMTHILNLGEWLVGPIDRLIADASHQALEGVEVEDTVNILARQGDVMASYSLNQFQAPNEISVTVACTEGTVRYEPHHNRWQWMVTPGNEWQDEVSPGLERDTLFTNQAVAFLDALEGSRPPLCSLDEGEQTLRVNLATLRTADDSASLQAI